MRRLAILLAAITVLVGVIPAVATAKKDSGPAYFVDESKLPFDALPGAEAMWGVHKGAGYQIEVPANWNGELVMWAHGFRGTGLELTVDPHPLRPYLILNGYAWAASSYSRNDYDVEAGAVDTRELTKLFKKLVDKPERTYITGASMGGHIVGASIEKWKKDYDGAMAICGVMGDFELFDFFADFNLAAQELGLGPTGSIFPVNAVQYLGYLVPAIKANLEDPEHPVGWPVALNEQGEKFKQLVELRSGGDRPNYDEAWYFWNTFPEFASGKGNFLFDLGVGDGTLPGRDGVVIDTTDAVYQLDLDPALSAEEQALNATIFRVEADKDARKRKGIKNVPPLEGKFDVPIITLHNLGDLFVPFHNEIAYARDVAAAGNSDLLVQRAIRGVQHCDFTPNELIRAFSELVTWVEDGVKPPGDIVLDPEVVADPEYGCTFTDGPHLFGTPCEGAGGGD